MAYQTINLGYYPSASPTYTATTDGEVDWTDVPINTYFYDTTYQRVFFKNELGCVSTDFQSDRSFNSETYSIASTQWAGRITTPLSLPSGQIANGMTQFDNANDKVAEGTTEYYEWNLSYGISLVLSGTSGTANINIGGVDYLITFDTSLINSAVNWVNDNYNDVLSTSSVTSSAIDSGVVSTPRIRFGSLINTKLDTITITTLTGNISGSLSNDFVGGSVSVYDHILVPYNDTPVFSSRIFHTMRVNFNIDLGNTQTMELGLYRYGDDSLIGSSIPIVRSTDVTGQQSVFETYTSNELDAFVLNGFYFALANNSGTAITLSGNIGMLFNNVFAYPISFNQYQVGGGGFNPAPPRP